MKTLQKMFFVFSFFLALAACQPAVQADFALMKPESRKAMMESIAADSSMSSEMMDVMMNGGNGKMVMMQHHSTMMEMMKNDSGMMDGMMDDMMMMCKGDTAKMAVMCKKMMEDPEMMKMMNKMQGKPMDMGNMKGMDANMNH